MPNSPEPTEQNNRFSRLEEGLARVESTLDQRLPAPASRTDTKGAVAFAAGWTGFKIGGLIGGKVGLIVAFLGHKKRAKLSQLKDNELVQAFYQTGVGALIGGVALAAVGGALGWFRGDRVGDPTDLLRNPIRSLRRMLGMEPAAEQAPPVALPAASTPHTDLQAQADQQREWTKTIEAEPAITAGHSQGR